MHMFERQSWLLDRTLIAVVCTNVRSTKHTVFYPSGNTTVGKRLHIQKGLVNSGMLKCQVVCNRVQKRTRGMLLQSFYNRGTTNVLPMRRNAECLM